MPSSAIGPLILFLAILLTGAHLLGYLFARLRQPRVIGEILAGCILGPFVLGRWAAYTHFLQLDVAATEKKAADRKSTRLNSSHSQISYAVFCLKKKKT